MWAAAKLVPVTNHLCEMHFSVKYTVDISICQADMMDIEGFGARLEIASFDDLAANHFGQVRAESYRKGRLIGPYDMMIAGHARALGLILVTNNAKQCDRVPGLRLENWA